MIKKVGVIGSGQMGNGIAHVAALAGFDVVLNDVTADRLKSGMATINGNLSRQVAKKFITEDARKQAVARIALADSMEGLSDCDLVIEAVFENMDIKKEVFGKLDAIAKKDAILASNTSYLDVDEIASVTGRPEQVLGMHFFSPANVMRLLEVVRGQKTTKPVIATVMQLARKIGKVAVLVGVCHGFVGNRMLSQRQREAQKLILEGAMPWDVDRVLYDFGLPMGPFAMSDLAGLDIGWSKETSKSSTIREILCEMGRRGQKTGAGFYDYDEARNAKPSPVVEKIVLDFAAQKGINRRSISNEEILERCIYPMINEGAKILQEGIAQRASDIDIVWINGYGWPVYRGGPMFYADLVGPGRILAKLKEFEATMGSDFTPAPLLEKLVAQGKRFQDL